MTEEEEKRLIKYNTLAGQLVAIENMLEEDLELEDYFEACDATGNISAYIKKAVKQIKDK